MQRTMVWRWVAVGLLVVAGAFEVMAKDPVFVRWMVAEDPGDRAILDYWERAERAELTPEELIDLGTMLFHRGFPGDALDYFERALDGDPNLVEAWFRIGLVEHKQEQLRQAQNAYGKCLKLSSGHGWCNFYMGLLLEEKGEAKAAIDHFRTAFRHAPDLIRPDINPEIMYSELALAAMLRNAEEQRFHRAVPMPLLQPAKVHKAGGFPVAPAPAPTMPPPVPVEPAAVGGVSQAVPGTVEESSPATGSTPISRRRGRRIPGDSGPPPGIPADTPYGTPLDRSRGDAETPGPRYSPPIGDVSPEAFLGLPWQRPLLPADAAV